MEPHGSVLGVSAVPGDMVVVDQGTIATTTTGFADTVLATAGFSTMDFIGLFNIFVGLMIVASLLIFCGGLITWMVRIGTLARTEGIRVMEWGVVILFVLIVLLAVVQFFQRNPWVATFIVALLIIGVVLWLIKEASQGGKEE